MRLHARTIAKPWVTRAALSTVVLAVIAISAACGGEPEVVVRPTSSATATPTASATGTGTITPSATVTPTTSATPIPTGAPGEVITSVRDLVNRYGYPPGSDFAHIRIPTIGVDARVGARMVGRDAVMPAPAGPADVVWYDLGLWDGLGGEPGEGRNAIFSGHVDYADPVPYANVSYRGQAVFSQVGLLSQGDVIEIDYRGQTLRYQVVWRQQVSAGGNTDWASIWSAATERDSITLYTCGGDFDFQTREYEDRVIVRAERI